MTDSTVAENGYNERRISCLAELPYMRNVIDHPYAGHKKIKEDHNPPVRGANPGYHPHQTSKEQ